MKVLNQTKGTTLASQATLANTPLSCLKGLIGESSLSQNSALIITDCRSIHMLFMRFPIDVVFLDKRCRVVGLVKNIGPFRLSPYFWRAYYAIELPVGAIDKAQMETGDIVLLD